MSKYIKNVSDSCRVVIEYVEYLGCTGFFMAKLQEREKFIVFSFWKEYFSCTVLGSKIRPDLDYMYAQASEELERARCQKKRNKESGWTRK